MNAAALALALNGRRSGTWWVARCPAHDDREPSLSISERDLIVLVHCHAGCGQAEVIAALRARGLWSGKSRGPVRDSATVYSAASDGENVSLRRERALALWAASRPAGGTIVETYLRSRSIRIPPPPTLRFHPALRHTSGAVFPVMIAFVTRGNDDVPLGVHRTFLAEDGSGKAPVTPQKMMLGPCGGGVVRLAAANGSVMIGEGLETCLSAIQATGRAAWAALSASGLRNVNLPAEIEDVIVLVDGDDVGEAAGKACAVRLQHAGRRVRIARPPAGRDFNDLLQADRGADR